VAQQLGQTADQVAEGYIPDTGLLAYLTGTNEDRLLTDTAGPSQACSSRPSSPWSSSARANGRSTRFGFITTATTPGARVDLVLERNSGDVIGVEVKAAATAGERDFRGLELLRGRLGRRFKAGAVLYTGDKTLPFGDRLAAVPIAGLWRDPA
jgi:uncharacterized protein